MALEIQNSVRQNPVTVARSEGANQDHQSSSIIHLQRTTAVEHVIGWRWPMQSNGSEKTELFAVLFFFLEQTYADESSNDTECVYHPGQPVFHEGLKFWTCCQRRTTDFQVSVDEKPNARNQVGETSSITFYILSHDPIDWSILFIHQEPETRLL